MSTHPTTNARPRRTLPRYLLALSLALAGVAVAQPVLVFVMLIADVALGGALDSSNGKAAELVDPDSLWWVALVAWAAALGLSLRDRRASLLPSLRPLATGAIALGLSWLAKVAVSDALLEEWFRLPSGQSSIEYEAQSTPAGVAPLAGTVTRTLTLGYSTRGDVMGLVVTAEGLLFAFRPGKTQVRPVPWSGHAIAASIPLAGLCAIDPDGRGECREAGITPDSTPWQRIDDQPLSALEGTALCGGRLCALRRDGRGRCTSWAESRTGAAIDALGTDLVAITPAFGCTGCAASRDGSARCFLTIPPDPGRRSGVVKGLHGAVRLSSVQERGCGIQEDGALVCWQLDLRAADLGLEGTRPLGDTRVVDVAVGPGHACAVTTQGTIRCWGENSWGALGDGTTEPRTEAVTVVGIGDAKQVAVAGSTSCAVHATGAVSCWGKTPRFGG